MSKVLLDKARAILAQTKHGPPPMASAAAGENNLPLTDKKFVCQPAAPNAKAIYWETGNGRILGPAVPEFLGRDGNTFWVSVTFDDRIWWINADRLRSHKAFLNQREVREVELIRTF